MSKNLKDLPPDPLHKEGSDEKPVKKKRTRRSRKQIDADDAAIALGFTNDADRQAKEGASTEPESVEARSTTGEAGSGEAQDKVEEEVVQRTVAQVGFAQRTRWNLGGTTYIAETLHDDGRVTFAPCLSK